MSLETEGWTIHDWVTFNRQTTPNETFKKLVSLVESQSTDDPAWISLASIDNLTHQWKVLQSKSDKANLRLYGVPIAIKDNIDVFGFDTTAACPSYAYKPEIDASVVKLLRDQGAIIIGKTNLDQFATGLVGTRSPYGITPCVFSKDHVSGGSSSGSSSVVGRGIVPIALGTDTAGSGRVPAALNNLIGLKPTVGVISTAGVVPACKSLDCPSIFALNLDDAQLCFSICAKPDLDNCEYSRNLPSNLVKQYPKNLKIAIPIDFHGLWYGDSENPKIYQKAIDNLKDLGAEIVPLDFSPLLDLAKCLYEGTWVAERYSAVKDFYETNPPEKDLDPTVTSIIKGGAKFSASTAYEYEYKRQGILNKVHQIFANVDSLLVPTCPLNPTIEQVLNKPVEINSIQGTWTNFANLADFSALAIPVGFRSDGLANGVTFLGKAFEDYALLDLAKRFFQQLYPNNDRLMGGLNKVAGNQDILHEDLPQPDLQKSIKLAVVGAHLKGLPLHWQLEKVQASLLKLTKTSENYKLYALPNTGPIQKPGLRRVTANGSKIEIEIYAVPIERFGEFISMVPEPLGIGSVETEDGEWVKSFICEEIGYTQKGSLDITDLGAWRVYMNKQQSLKSSRKKPFNKVLVANRGEIAVRIIKTLKKLGIRSVAVYSDPDKYAEHVLLADEAVALKGTSASETYIDMEKMINAVKLSKAEAVIPGYGFLSENADFADLLKAAGVVWVGPDGDAIRKLGLKHSAREIAEKAGVPLVPGSGLVSSAGEAKEIAKKLTYPIMVKSTAGGGGIGLQKVDSEDDIERVFETVQHQGKSYFGDSGVFLERFVENSRHVEIQMFGDGHGKAIAIGERDCSLQRRNQKVIEETPAPNLPEATRQKMRKAAEQLGASMNYKCAGTVEFIYDEKRDEFYFLEVNARLQVEHPVTEMVTGLDLVEWMLFIAADMSPDFSQVVKVEGASMEARLYAENPVKDFKPSPGQLIDIKFPEWARVDTWVKPGTFISSEYDPTLAKIIVHGKDRAEALSKLRKALNETVVYGCVSNIDYLRSVANSKMFEEATMHTKILDSYDYKPNAFELTNPGAYTTVQDYPGRVNYWRIGVPPSGPMDSYSFRLANRIVGNHFKAPAIEITLNGPSILFHHETVIAVTGGSSPLLLNDEPINMYEPIEIKRGDRLVVGKLTTGCRSYLAIRGGIDVTEYLGSRSTFALGNLGGYNGRQLKMGDVLFLGQPGIKACTLPEPVSEPLLAPQSIRPKISITKEWTVGVTCGPHGSPDFFKEESIKDFFSNSWKVHYNSNRFGVRLIGPKPKWARNDGGEGGLHPSNAHDYVYSLGAINFTGDEPVILTCDGPSLGGFVCQAVVASAEMWKIGQVKPGDMIKFVPISFDDAVQLTKDQNKVIELFAGDSPSIENASIEPENPILATTQTSTNAPIVTYRQAGDKYVLVEYGETIMDLNYSYRVHKLIEMVESHKTIGIVEMSQGVRSVLIEFDGLKIHQKTLVETLIAYESEVSFTNKWTVPSRVIKLPMAFEDKKTLDAVTRYQETIRSDAPWLPNNVDFIANINGIERSSVKDMLYAARFLVLGLGDVFLGAPCAVPLDPRHRFLGSKYNPSRTFTPNGTVGIGGMFMCIYTMESPGGYQLVGRTIPIWDKLSLGNYTKKFNNGNPWLLTPFDQVSFYPVSEEELEQMVEDSQHGHFEVEMVESVFDHSKYLTWIQENSESIEAFQRTQHGEKLDEFKRLIQVSNAELEKSGTKVDESAEELPENAVVIYSEYSGRFWKSLVNAGDEVKDGQGLVVIEAMKTEMAVNATANGKVLKIYHKNGDMVEAGDVVAVIV